MSPDPQNVQSMLQYVMDRGEKNNNFKYASKSKVINVDINIWVLVLKYMSKSMQSFQELVAKMHIY